MNEIIRKLSELGYFKYVPSEDKQKLENEVLENLTNSKSLDTEWDENLVSREKRSYFADNEELAEGGIGELLHHMQDVLKQEGISNLSVEEDFQSNHYFMQINGQIYKIYEMKDDTGKAGWLWMTAFKRCIEVVNDLLTRAGSNERLYGQYGGNEGRVIFLTPQLLEYIKTLDIDSHWMPFSTEQLNIASL